MPVLLKQNCTVYKVDLLDRSMTGANKKRLEPGASKQCQQPFLKSNGPQIS